MCEVHDAAVDMIGHERAAPAALLPPGSEHEMIDNQLAASGEKVGQRLLAVWPVEHIGLLHLDPGQFTALGTQLIAQPGEFLFLDQELLARGEPLVSRYDSVVLHDSISFPHSASLEFVTAIRIAVDPRH